MSKGRGDSGFGTSSRPEVAKELYGNLAEQVKKAVVQLYNINKGDGQDNDVTLWAAEQVKKITNHAANFTAAKILEKLEEEKRRKEREERNKAAGLLELVAALAKALGDGSGSSSENGGGVADHSTGKIKFPISKEAELGHGAFGVVFRAKGADGFQFALKEVDSAGDEADCLRQEIECLTKLSHKNIVSCFGYAEGGGKIYMFLELLTGSIADRIERTGKACTEAEAKKYTIDAVKGLSYLHDNDIIHRDIKCANVLLDGAGMAKLGDMGLSKVHTRETLANYGELGGSIFWMSPEALSNNAVGKRPDIWSLGCTIYEMIKKVPPLFQAGIMGFLLIQATAASGGCAQHRDAVTADAAFKGELQDFLLEIFVPLEDRPYINRLAGHKWLS